MSWRNINTVIFFTFVSRSLQTGPITRRTVLFRLPDLDGRILHNWTVIASSSSLWECAAMCSADNDCGSVSFKPTSGECVIYNRWLSTTDHFTISLSAVSFGVCPFGFSIMGRWCIKVVTDRLNMLSAREHCRDLNADLITLDTQAKIGQFRDFMVANDYGSDHEFFWCGVCEVNGVWQWINGKTFSSSSDVWCPNEPNIASEKCAVTRTPANNCIYDIQCHTVNKFVCEIQF